MIDGRHTDEVQTTPHNISLESFGRQARENYFHHALLFLQTGNSENNHFVIDIYRVGTCPNSRMSYEIASFLITVISVSLQEGRQSQARPGREAQRGFSVVTWFKCAARHAIPVMLQWSSSAEIWWIRTSIFRNVFLEVLSTALQSNVKV